VGGTGEIKVDVRVISATNRDLDALVADGRFREDLYYRINTLSLRTPALREHPQDIPALATHFASAAVQRHHWRPRRLSPEALALLQEQPWKGNVRELRNVVERAVLLGQPGRPIDLPELPDALAAHASGAAEEAKHGSLRDKLASYERELIQQALEKAGGVIRRAAAQLQTDPVTFARRARRYGLPLRSPLGGL
jgi:DNA-binding NtrC family response regulator